MRGKYFIFFFFVFTGFNFCRAEEDYKIFVGEAFTVESPAGVEKIFIRKPEIVDLIEVRPNQVEFIGKAPGFTEIEIRPKSGDKQIFEVMVLSEDLDSLAHKIRELIAQLGIKDAAVGKDTLNSKVILTGEITQAHLDTINKVTQSYASVITNLLKVQEEVDLVQINAEIMELTKGLIDQLGVDWSNSVTFTEKPQYSSSSTTGDKLGQVMHVVDWTRSALSFTAYMREHHDKGKILAQPKLVCLSGKEASFIVGGEVPLLTYEGGNPSIEYKDYGVELNVNPVIRDDEEGIMLGLKTEVSEIDSSNALNVTVYIADVGSSTYSIPAFTNRNTETQLFLKEGQTVFISGLLKDRVTEDDLEKVPGLANVPILGALFRSKDYQAAQTDLVITLTPKIIRQRKDKAKVSAQEISAYRPIVKKEEGISLTLASYVKEVQSAINEGLIYPPLAKAAGWQATLKASIHLNSEGEVLSVRIIESSGHRIFDETTVKLIKELGPYLPFPPQLDAKELWIDIPIVYKLD